MSNRIQVKQEIVNRHMTAISGNSSSFNVRLPNVTGGNVSVIATADSIGTELSGFSRRYASALPNSARDIQRIADSMAHVDAEASRSMGITR